MTKKTAESSVAVVRAAADRLVGAVPDADYAGVEIDGDGYVRVEMRFGTGAVSPRDAAAVADRLRETAAAHGWFLAQLEIGHGSGGQFRRLGDLDGWNREEPVSMVASLFPTLGRRLARVPEVVYHVAPADRADAIRGNGLAAARGGTDFVSTPQERVYVVLNPLLVEWVANDLRRHRGAADLVVVGIDAEGLGPFYADVEWEGGDAAWTPTSIPAEHVLDVVSWRDFQADWRRLASGRKAAWEGLEPDDGPSAPGLR